MWKLQYFRPFSSSHEAGLQKEAALKSSLVLWISNDSTGASIFYLGTINF